jgi:amino acid transporter
MPTTDASDEPEADNPPSHRGASPPNPPLFERTGDDIYTASLEASEPETPLEHVQRFLFGQPIPERLASREGLNRTRALATLSSDGLSSVAYGTEASLAVLISAGFFALSRNLVIGLVTAVLMIIVGSSYRQTIHAYPRGGGSYTVARDNLGVVAGLVAAAALLIDYLLTVSVSVASGIDAIASAFTVIAPFKLPIELAAIALMMLLNLRGLRSSGTVFAFPTYFFLGSFGLMLVAGVVQAILHGGLAHAAPMPVNAVTSASPLASLSVLLILTAFASGCSAMTGVEAISNGVPAFAGNTPAVQSKHAAQTLTIMIFLLVTFFLGTTYLAWRVSAVPNPNGDPTVTSQIARFAFPPGSAALGWLFYVVQTATLLILVFAANTSFAGFPRLSAILAHDSFAPALFAYRGERIAFNVGIVALGVLSALVLAALRGNVVALINLYALGVFTAFTLSQSGMVVHWLRRRNQRGWQGRLATNAVGAAATAVVALVIGVTKFDRGAWVVVVLIPLLVLSFLGIHRYYCRPKIIQTGDINPASRPRADVVFMPIFSHQSLQAPQARQRGEEVQPTWQQVFQQELAYAATIAPQIRLVRVVGSQEEADTYCSEWMHYVETHDPGLAGRVHTEALVSPFRTAVLPIANFLRWRRQTDLADKRVAVLLPRELHPSLWEWPLQRWIARRVHQELQQEGSGLQLVDLPYTLGK